MPEPWSTPHELRMQAQVQHRTGDTGWREVQHTGLVHLMCNCGYSTGWIAQADLPTREQLTAEHGEP